LATVVIGGVIGAMIMSLLVLRVLYLIFNVPVERLHNPARVEPPATAEAELVSASR
jgi:cobalt-zinc-cadmium resistance protein CzcA